MIWKLAGALGLALAVAACGTNPNERTTGGAAAGAATGAGVGALGGPVGALAGAAIGAGAGAVTGATTDPKDVNLGKPPWTNPEANVPGTDMQSTRRAPRVSENARAAQQELARLGFDPGPADGVWGQRSTDATLAFQRAHNLTTTGRPDAATLAALRSGPGDVVPPTGPPAAAPPTR